MPAPRATLIAAAICAALSSGVSASETTTPIRHLIVVVGENVSFDTLFATYTPAPGQSVRNLLSEGIVTADGNPGPRYADAVQDIGTNRHGRYTLEPTRLEAYAKLPQPVLTGAYDPNTLQLYPPIPDPRFAALDLNGPFQITKFVPYGTPTSALGDPPHRFFQMWQQTGGSNRRHDMFAWVATTAGTGGDNPDVSAANPGQGGELMGYFNMARGDAPYFNQLAQSYAISDNYHQSVMGGTGANFFSLATGDMAVYRLNGKLAVPPANQIENPDPQPRSDNFYIRDGYAGGSYVKCADLDEPGVAPIRMALAAQVRDSKCARDTYYLVNNYDTPYTIAGAAKPLGADKFVYPPQTVPTIGEALSAKGVAWKWYTGGRDFADAIGDPLFPLVRVMIAAQVPSGTPDAVIDALAIAQTQTLIYNSIGDPLNASANVVNGPLRANLQGLDSFYKDVKAGALPAVSFVVPKNVDSGHPGYSVPGKYELFIADLLARVQADPALWADTAVVVTTDEGGGYFDTGAIENLDFFGDGPRIPLLVVSPYARRGHVDHVYQDHASILKFIERNWRLAPLSARSRDRLPDARMAVDRSYRPVNGAAIGDLMSLFDFCQGDCRGSGERRHGRDED
jgi:acid phosphatase